MNIVPLTTQSPEPLLRALHVLRVQVHEERQPDIVAPTFAETVLTLTSKPNLDVSAWAALVDGTLVGFCTRDIPTSTDDDHVRIDGAVATASRRRGIGRALLHSAMAGPALQRTTVLLTAVAGTEADGFARQFAFTRAVSATRSALDLSTLDWREIAGPASGDATYEVLMWQGTCPDAWVRQFASARQSMADAPTGDSRVQTQWDVPRVRAEEQANAARGDRHHVVCLYVAGTDEIVALTEVTALANRPAMVRQGDTCVIPAHRGRGLGIRVKALMLQRLTEHEPQARVISTWNADDNSFMLAINQRLGFRPRETWIQWEASPIGVMRMIVQR